MKKVLFTITTLALSVQPALASGSLDYICVSEKSNIRYEYHDGDGTTEATVFRASGIDQDKALKEVLGYNSLTLDAFQVSRILTRTNIINAVQCDEYDKQGYAKCLASPASAVIKEDSKTEEEDSFGKKVKYLRTIHTDTLKDGTKLELNIRTDRGNLDDGSEMSGTLTITSPRIGYTKVPVLKVRCAISTP